MRNSWFHQLTEGPGQRPAKPEELRVEIRGQRHFGEGEPEVEGRLFPCVGTGRHTFIQKEIQKVPVHSTFASRTEDGLRGLARVRHLLDPSPSRAIKTRIHGIPDPRHPIPEGLLLAQTEGSHLIFTDTLPFIHADSDRLFSAEWW